jgi:hypothetical protein
MRRLRLIDRARKGREAVRKERTVAMDELKKEVASWECGQSRLDILGGWRDWGAGGFQPQETRVT